jgi:hypothetical protein
MKKVLLTLVIALTTVCVFAQNSTDTTKKNNQPQQIQYKPTDTLALFQGRPGGPLKLEEITKGDSLFLNKGGFMIVGFTLVYRGIGSDTTLKKFDSKTNKLTAEMKTGLAGLKENQKFQFVNIRYTGKDNVMRKPTNSFIDMMVDKTATTPK